MKLWKIYYRDKYTNTFAHYLKVAKSPAHADDIIMHKDYFKRNPLYAKTIEKPFTSNAYVLPIISYRKLTLISVLKYGLSKNVLRAVYLAFGGLDLGDDC